MSEVPEHLLQRSAARRAALSGGEAPAAAAPEASTSVESAGASPAAAAPVAAATPAVVEPPKPPPPYVQEALKRKKIPFWAMAVVGFLPLWAILYAGSLSEASTGELTQLALGAQIYSANCASCHGASGGGGVGRPFVDGQIVATFPDIEAQIEFIAIGSTGVGQGNPYGDPNRPGGPHISGSTGSLMPAFGEVLTPAELFAVARYEREVLGGEEVTSEMLGPDGERLNVNGDPYISDTGELVNADGEPLLDETFRLTIQIADGQSGATTGAGS